MATNATPEAAAGLTSEAADKLAKDGWGDQQQPQPIKGNGKETLQSKFDRLVEKLKTHGIHFS